LCAKLVGVNKLKTKSQLLSLSYESQFIDNKTQLHTLVGFCRIKVKRKGHVMKKGKMRNEGRKGRSKEKEDLGGNGKGVP